MNRDQSDNRPKTAAALIKELQRDPKYQDKLRRISEEQRLNIERYKQAAAPLVADLCKAGISVTSIGDLRWDPSRLSVALPILLKWLPRISELAVKEDIVRTLSVPCAKPAAAKALIHEFKRAVKSTGLRWAIANALEIVADASVFEELGHLATDRQLGKDREMLVLALGNMPAERAIPLLILLLQDDEVAGHAVMALGKLKASGARSRIEPFLKHSKQWIREEAKKALEQIN